MLRVRDRVADDAFQERLEHAAGFFVNHCVDYRRQSTHPHIHREGRKRKGGEGERERTGRDTLDASTAREAADGGLGDALDVVAEDLAVAFGAAFAEAFAAFSACGFGVSEGE